MTPLDPVLYQQAVTDAVILNLSHLRWLEVKGNDARKFLNGTLSNNITTLSDKNGCYNVLLTPKGKFVADLYCYACGDHFGLIYATEMQSAIEESLKRYIVFQKVALSPTQTSWTCVGVLGPQSDRHLNFLTSLPQKELEYTLSSWSGVDLWIIRRSFFGLAGYEIWIPENPKEKLLQRLNLPQLDFTTEEVLRIESATPKFEIDFDDKTIPQEANLHHALSFNKGCYIGQEVVTRLEHRGHVTKQLQLLRWPKETIPESGSKIFSHDGKEIGWVTSSCYSPKHQSVVALGYIQYQYLTLTTWQALPSGHSMAAKTSAS